MPQKRRAVSPAVDARVGACVLVGLLCVSSVQAAPLNNAGATAALRRACATGALTAYTCARHGITAATPAAPAPEPRPTVPAVPAAPIATLPARAPVTASAPAETTPANVRDRRRRARVDDGPSVRPFQDTKRRYDLQIPDGWELKMQGGFATFAHGDDWIQLRAATAPTAQAAAAAGIDLLRDQYDGFQTSADADATVGGRPGRRMVLSATSKAGRPSSIIVVAAPMSGGSNLVVIAGGGPAEASTIDAGVAAIVRTLHFR